MKRRTLGWRRACACLAVSMSLGAQPVLGQIPGLPSLPGFGSKSDGGSSDSGMGKMASQILGCGIGGLGGAALAKAWARSDGKRLKLSGDQAKKREKGYMIGLAMAGCVGAGALAGTAYSKLSDAGRKNREQELAEAARSAQERTYKDPENPAITGHATPGPVYTDASSSRECRDVEDVLADAGKGEPVVVKYCRSEASGAWAPATA